MKDRVPVRVTTQLQKKIKNDSTLVAVNSSTHDNLLSLKVHNGMQQKSSTCISWHATMIKWCLYLNHKSSSAYNLLKSSKVIPLPSQRTLRDYSHHYKSSSGFSVELDNQLMTKFSSTTEEYQGHVSLIDNEMYIKESLVYSKASGELVGFCEIGDINDHFLLLEQKYQKDEEMHLKFAKKVLVVMICGHFTDITFSYATFPATNLTGEQLIPIFLEAIMSVETCGLRVTSITLDGSSVIRKYIKYLKKKALQLFFKIDFNKGGHRTCRLAFFS